MIIYSNRCYAICVCKIKWRCSCKCEGYIRKREPEQTEPPVVEAVGNVFTLTLTGVPKLVPMQLLASLNAVIEYVPAAAVVIVKVVVG